MQSSFCQFSQALKGIYQTKLAFWAFNHEPLLVPSPKQFCFMYTDFNISSSAAEVLLSSLIDWIWKAPPQVPELSPNPFWTIVHSNCAFHNAVYLLTKPTRTISLACWISLSAKIWDTNPAFGNKVSFHSQKNDKIHYVY